ncbi:MAG: ABC-F type ribosomal protection protein [Clostridiales bacterium]|jgi:lincosamide and streptogramin A transport system ATP-binding/permease protein|nr:ABC-F type ribosomal protection protein [Clostridiales bacterium]
MSQIDIANLTFSYENMYDPIFENVSFQIDTDWRLGFTGRNGRGKTTFLRLLLGELPYSGRITASVGFEYFPCRVSDETKDAFGVAAEICPGAAEWELRRELSLLNVSDDALRRPFHTLSDGERTKALLAALFLKENAFLLIDEPTNHLDAEARAAVGRWLRGKKGYILVSHDRAFLDSCADHILSINKTGVEVQRGNFSSWMENKARRDSFETDLNERLKKDIARLETAAKRAENWAGQAEGAKYGGAGASGLKPDRGYMGHKAAKMMKTAKSIEARRHSAALEKSSLLKNVERAETLSVSPLLYRAETLAVLENVGVSYGGAAVCSGVNFTVGRGERVALCGRNGTGKSSLLKLLNGENVPHGGNFRLGSGITVSYIPQDASGLSGSLTDYARLYGVDESLFKAILAKLDFSKTQFEKDMRDFSGGQQKKVLIARSLCERAHLYLWDEPLNFVDVLSRMQIEDLLLACRPTIVFIEHDAAFVDRVATKRVFLG